MRGFDEGIEKLPTAVNAVAAVLFTAVATYATAQAVLDHT